MNEVVRNQSNGVWRWMSACAVLLIALSARLAYPVPAPFFDEFFHALAARSLLHEGTLNLAPEAEVPYTRGTVFTYLVAGSYQLFGESWWAARLPSVLAGSFLVMGVFMFVRREAGPGAAWLSSMLVCFVPELLYLSNWSRFYMLQMLAVFVGATAIYRAVWPMRGCSPEAGGQDLSEPLHIPRGHRAKRAWYAFVAVMGFGLALHLQPTTLIPLLAVGVWMAMLVGWYWYGTQSRKEHRPGWRTFAVMAAVAASLLVLAWQLGWFDKMWDVYSRPRVWAMGRSDDVGYYQRQFFERQMLLWIVFPAAIITVLAFRPALGIFASTIFIIAILAHSLIWIKAMRYISYATPFFCIVAGTAASVWLGALAGQVRGVWGAFAGQSRPRVGRVLGVIGVVATMLFVGYRTPDYHNTLRVYGGDLNSLPYRHNTWEPAIDQLAPYHDAADVVISAAPVHTLYYFGQYDAMINRTTQGNAPDGALYRYDGRPMFSTGEALDKFVNQREHQRGLILMEDGDWRLPVTVTDSVSDWIEAHAKPLALSGAPGIRAYWWGPPPPELADPPEADTDE